MLDKNATNLASYEVKQGDETNMAESRLAGKRIGGRYDEMVKGGSPWAHKSRQMLSDSHDSSTNSTNAKPTKI